jgi:hypothetical protein
MADGTAKAIEKVKTGDLVLTRDQHDDANGKVVAKKVLKTSVRHAPATLTVILATGEKIECTPEHPFYVDGKGFTRAGELGIGTSIVTRAGPAVQVAGIKRHFHPATVYNFVVEDTHTYFVGAANGGVEVHNDCTDIALKFQQELGGDVYRVTPKEGDFLNVTTYPEGETGWYNYHDVHYQDGMVRDPMLSGSNNPIPVDQWKSAYFGDFNEVHNFGKVF